MYKNEGLKRLRRLLWMRMKMRNENVNENVNVQFGLKLDG